MTSISAQKWLKIIACGRSCPVMVFSALLLILFIPCQLFSQSSFTWYFGNQAGIKFNPDGSTVPYPGSHMNASEGCTVVSDTTGVIMFYSDGISVWNNSSSIPVSTALPGSTSATQAALALAIPGSDCQRFLIFTTKGIESAGAHDLGVALVNVSGTAPNYTVSVSEPALSVLQPPGSVIFAEKLAAISDTAGGYWVVAHDYVTGTGTANTFYKYHITSAGFSAVTTTAQAQAALAAVQQTQSVGSNHRDLSAPAYNAQGQMKFSNTGQKLALVLTGSKTIDLFSFNLGTGLLTQIATTNITSSNGNLYGCELSPNGNILYTSEGFASSGATIRKLYQWDISAGTLVNPYIVASGGNIYNNKYKFNALQLAPNDKIYCSEELSISFLSVINNPNVAGSGCGWSSMSIPIAGSNTLGLTTVIPNFGCACLPSPGAVTGPSSVCRGASGKVYTAAAVPGATGYDWSVPPGAVITSGNNTSTITVTFTGTSVSGTISVHAFNASCTGLNSPGFPVTVSLSPTVALGPDTTICQGQAVTFNAGACTGCSYQWSNLATGQPNIGTGQTYTTGTAGIYAVSVTNPSGCTGRDTIHLIVQSAVPVSVSITASANPVCSGTQVSFSATGLPGGMNSGYAWSVNGITVPGAVTPVYSCFPSDGDCVQCVFTSTVSCASGNPATSDPVCMTVSQTMPVSVSVTGPSGPVCAGGMETFTAIPVNPGAIPLYQWYVNNVPAGSNSPVFSYTPADGECVTCSLYSGFSCTSGNPALSGPVCMVVNPLLPVSVDIQVSANPVCSGTAVTCSAFPVNGGSSPGYQWKVNDLAVSGATNSGFNFVPANGDQVRCTVTSPEACAISNPATSAPLTLSVNPPLPVSVTIASSANPFCSGSQVTFAATAVNGGNAAGIQWFVNGMAGGSGQWTYSMVPSQGDEVSCLVTSSETCTSGNPAASNGITMIETPLVSAGVSVFTSENPMCHGNTVIFTAIPVNGGLAPAYQWKVNGNDQGAPPTGTFSYQPAPGDVVTCVMTSAMNCVISNPVTSPAVTMNEYPLPVVTFSRCFDTVTLVNARPYILRGGCPAGGMFSGPGVNPANGEFSPASAGSGLHTITYSYSNIYQCTASKSGTILVNQPPFFTCGGPFTDIRDNGTYATVLIGNQCWMKENLRYGTPLAGQVPQTDNCLAERYQRVSSAGGTASFYQWDELMDYTASPGARGICPPGWHLPSQTEWEQLLDHYEGPGKAAGPLKDPWINGFGSQEDGLLYQNNTWAYVAGIYAGTMFWTSEQVSPSRAEARGINAYNMSVSRYQALRNNAFNARCVKD